MDEVLVVNFKYVAEIKLNNIEISILSENLGKLKKCYKETDIFGQKLDLTGLELYFDLSDEFVHHSCDRQNENQEANEYILKKGTDLFIPISSKIDTDIWLEYITKHTDNNISAAIESQLLEDYPYKIQITQIEIPQNTHPFYLDIYNQASNDFFQLENRTLHFEKKNLRLDIGIAGELRIGEFETLQENTPYDFFKKAHPSIFKQFFCFRNKPFVGGKELFFTEEAKQQPVFALKTLLTEKDIIEKIDSKIEIEQITFGKTLRLSIPTPHSSN